MQSGAPRWRAPLCVTDGMRSLQSRSGTAQASSVTMTVAALLTPPSMLSAALYGQPCAWARTRTPSWAASSMAASAARRSSRSWTAAAATRRTSLLLGWTAKPGTANPVSARLPFDMCLFAVMLPCTAFVRPHSASRATMNTCLLHCTWNCVATRLYSGGLSVRHVRHEMR